MFYLIVLWLRAQVRQHYAIHDKLSVVWHIAEVASVSYISGVGGAVIVVDALVNPVPDATAHDIVVRLYDFPVVLQIAHGLPHGVGIFTEIVRVFEITLFAGNVLHAFHRRVHA